MAYLQHRSWKDRPGAVVGVVAIHAVIGYALVTGLNFTQIVERVKNPQAIDVVVPLPPPPPTPPQPDARADEAVVDKPVVAPKPIIDVSPIEPNIDTTPVIIPTPDTTPYVAPRPTPSTTPAGPSFNPIAAKPRGNPGNWVTVDDYRTSWINREMVGTARFRLEVASSGRVQNCTITASSGHAELDRATCSLVTQRARFVPAKDGTGASVTGSYVSSVRWELPE